MTPFTESKHDEIVKYMKVPAGNNLFVEIIIMLQHVVQSAEGCFPT